MKRILSLAAAALITLILSSCASSNNGTNTRNMTNNNGGINIGRLSAQNNISGTNARYRDGIYSAYGDTHENGNEMATMIIRNGRIVGISLTNVGRQNTTTNNIGNGTATQHQGRTNNQTGDGMGMNKPGRTETGNDNLTGVNNQGTNNQSGTGMSNAIGISAGVVKGDAGDDALNEIRTRLVDLMLRGQRADVAYDIRNLGSISSNDAAYLNNMIMNWKVAASRAVNQARI